MTETKNKAPGTNEERLASIRTKIDELDKQIQDLISQRARCAQEVAQAKLGARNGFYRPEREVDVLRRVIARNRGPLSDEEMARLFREIMSACLALQAPLTVAYFGPAGTYTHAAALKHFGHSVRALPMAAIDEVFREVESGAAQFGVVPVENSSEGAVSSTLDTLIETPLRICGEVELRVHHHLLAKTKRAAGVKRIVAHAQALAQCREWLDANLPNVKRLAVASNAEAARMAAKQAGVAAIAGSMAAEIYGLKIVAENIEDRPDNTTRFLIIGKLKTHPSGKDKTSLVVSAANRPGVLHELLAPLAQRGIDMSRIESRPARRGLWQYVFFLDVEGHEDEERVRLAIEELKGVAAFVKPLGSYPKAIL